jgi:hypothetical protein
MPSPQSHGAAMLSVRSLLVLCIIIAPSCFAQAAKPTMPLLPLSLAERSALATPILLQAERESTSVTLDPASRSLLLYRTAGAWVAIDRPHAIRLYRESFASARSSPLPVRARLEQAVLEDLLPLSPSDVLSSLPQTEAESQAVLYKALINFLLFQGDYPTAVRAFDRGIANGILPPGTAIHLLASLPSSASVERKHIFDAVLHYYLDHPDPDRHPWDLSGLIAHFYQQFPSALALVAVDTVLAEAKREDDDRPGIFSCRFGYGNLRFYSCYDTQLFAVVPALQKLDPAWAAHLLAQHAEVAADLRSYPQGLASLDSESFSPSRTVIRPDERLTRLKLYNAVEYGQDLSRLDMGLEFTVPRNLSQFGVTGALLFWANPKDPEASILEWGGSCPTDVPHRLELAGSVPIRRRVPPTCAGTCGYLDTFPRADLIQAIAERCTYYDGTAGARAALHDQLDLLTQMPEETQLSYLANAADLYLRLGDREAATGVVQRGFSVARTIYDDEQRSFRAPSGFWPAAEAYRRMITLGVNASFDATSELINEIPDSGLRELEQVMLARALLGVPVRRYFIGDGAAVAEAEIAYGQF